MKHIGTTTATKQPVLAATKVRNLRLTLDSSASGRLFYAPTADTLEHYGFLEPGESVCDYTYWDEVWVRMAWGRADVGVWGEVGLSLKTPPPSIGTTFKGGHTVDLPSDGTVVQLSSTVVGVHGLTLAQDPRNHRNSIVWVTTHVDLAPAQQDSMGKPVPGSGPPRGDTDRRFPLLHGQYLEIPGFNSAVWAWAEPHQNQGPIRVYFAKHGFGV